jgi:hypothetical protein
MFYYAARDPAAVDTNSGELDVEGPEVLAVVLSGSHATRIADAESDLDMYVYCSLESIDLGIRVNPQAVRNDECRDQGPSWGANHRDPRSQTS